jgi:hypothetical protein
MANLILALKTMLAIIPEVLAAIRAVESPGNGGEKTKAILLIVAEAFGALPDELKALIDASKFGKYVEKVIEILVNLLNVTGIFKKST